MEHRTADAFDKRALTELSRRRFLQIAGVMAGGGVVSVLAACTAAAPANPTLASAPPTVPPAPVVAAAPTASAPVAISQPTPQLATTARTGGGVYPTYIPLTTGPKADYPSTGPLYEDGFNAYPANPVQSFSGDPPGAGGTVTIMSIQLFPPPTPFDQNPAWQAVNKAMNADVQFRIVTSADYPVKLATAMASNDLPDMLYMYAQPGTASALAAAPGVPQFLQAQAADLTPYLAGDAIKDYPNLAAIPTSAWKNAGCAYNGHLYMVPIHRYQPGMLILKNTEVWDGELGQDYVPKNADDFKRALKALTRQDFYGIAAAQNTMMYLPQFAQLFRAPNDWRLQPDGKLVKDIETPEFKEATAYERDLYASGVFHPDSTTYASGVIARAQFAARKFAVWFDPFNGWQDGWRQALQSSQPFQSHMIPPFAAQDGAQSGHFITGGHLWATALKKAPPERIKELLRILNYMAVPFGSAEDQLLTFGLKDIDYTLDANGNPTLTPQGNTDANYVPWKYVVQHPFVFFTPDVPDYARVATEAEHQLMPVAITNPTFGQVSATNFSKGFTLSQNIRDGLTDIIVGRRPFSDYEQVVQSWQNSGGEQVRKEYMESIAASG